MRLSLSALALSSSLLASVSPAHAGESRFPVAIWRDAKVKGWLVDGPTECARDLIRDLASAGVSGTIALTLDAAGTHARQSGFSLLSVRASASRAPRPRRSV